MTTTAPVLRTGPVDTGPPLRPGVRSPRVALAAAAWLVVLALGLALSAGPLGAVSASRSQTRLLTHLRSELATAAAAVATPLGPSVRPQAAVEGAPVALLQVPALGLQQVVVEGVRPRDTRQGPGHVPGTAGPGQAGAAVVVGRRAGYGGAFARLGRLRPGALLVVTTAQGRSVYRVTRSAGAGADRLTLRTARGPAPWDWHRDRAVVAALVGRPFAPTPQGVRPSGLPGRDGDGTALPLAVVWGSLLLLASAASLVLYRRWLLSSTYLLTTPVLLGLTVLFADAASQLLPAWV